MIVTGASVEDIAVIVRAVSATRYSGNVEIRDISDKSSSRTVRSRTATLAVQARKGREVTTPVAPAHTGCAAQVSSRAGTSIWRASPR